MNELPSTLYNSLLGSGIVSGFDVYADDKYCIYVTPGTAVTSGGSIFQLKDQRVFQNYYKEIPETAKQVAKDFINSSGITDKFDFWVLAEGDYDANTMDPLKAQYKTDDEPQRATEVHGTFLHDKILVLLSENPDSTPAGFHFILMRDDDVARLVKIDSAVKHLMDVAKPQGVRPGIFSKNKKQRINLDPESIDMALRPQLQLPEVVIPRFGYKTLAYKDPKFPIDMDDPPAGADFMDNLRNPFAAVFSFKDIFLEYKAILDKAVPELVEALAKLHKLFGHLLTHRDEEYLKLYGNVLARKWWAFKYGGEQFYYIQYFYDWVCDLAKAYHELRDALDNFSAAGFAPGSPSSREQLPAYLLLGPVTDAQSSYKPLIFRDYFRQPIAADNNADRLREIRCLHWRLMMMIWTFDLPFLHLEEKKFASTEKPEPGVELKDSTDYWEHTDRNKDDQFNIEDVPIKITPCCSPAMPLGCWPIPYYYPLDRDSPYSLHRFWNYHATKMNRTDTLLSFNANRGTDSYTQLPQVLFPLAYNIREYSFFRVEGLVGKGQSNINQLLEVLRKFNIALSVVKVDVSCVLQLKNRTINGVVTDEKGNVLNGAVVSVKEKNTATNTNNNGYYEVQVDGVVTLLVSLVGYITQEIEVGLEDKVNISLYSNQKRSGTIMKIESKNPNVLSKLYGLERVNCLQPGHTLVILYTGVDEQIELSECRKDITPEITKNTIVGDFTLPYRLTEELLASFQHLKGIIDIHV